VNPNTIVTGSSTNNGHIYLDNSAQGKTLRIHGSFTDYYGFLNDNIQTTYTISTLSGIIASAATYVSSPRYFAINISSLTNAFGSSPTSGSSFSGFTASNGGTSVTVVQPSLLGSTVTAGQFQAINSTSSHTYAISGTFTDDYGFSTNISTNITVPAPTFEDHNIEWDGSNYSRNYKLEVIANNSVSTYAWDLSGTGSGSIISGATSSNVTLSTDVASTKTLNCSGMTQTNNQGFTKTGGTANSLNFNNYVADSTFSTYAVSHSNGLTFTLTETNPTASTIDSASNTNRINSRVWGDSDSSTGSTVTLSDNYLIDNGNDATLGCDVNTQNIVGFVKTRVAADVQVSGSFTAFDSSGHRLSFTDLTTPSFSVRIDSIAYTASTNAKFRLIYYGSNNNSSNIGISGNNYTNYEYIKMFARSVCDRGFQNNNETYLATFDASNNLPAPPPAPTVSLVGSLHNKTTNSVTFSNITSNAAHVNSHGIPNRTGITIGIKRSLDSNSNYSNLTNQVFGSNVTVTGLTAGTKYYFKYEKTYRTGLWTQVDLSPSLYLSESGVYTSVTTLNTPTFTNQIYVSWWIEPRYTRISLANMSYNSNDGININYNSTYNVKLYISKTSANLFTGTQTSTLSVYSGSIYQTENLSDLNSNYCIALSSINLNNEINITYDRFSSATIWKTLYLGLEIQYDNYYSNVQTPPLSIKTRAYLPSLAKIHTNITSFSANINYGTGNAQISITRTTANSSWWYQFIGTSPNGVPSLLPSNIYLVISSDSNTIKQSHNINFGAAAPSNILKHKGSDMYGVIDMISNDTLTADVPLTNKSVYAGDLYIAFLSIYPTPNIPGTLSYISDDDEIPDYRLESTAIPYNYTSALAGNHATSIPLTEPTTHSHVSITRHADTTTDTLVWTFDSVTYAHGNYEVTDFKWGVNSNTNPGGFRRTGNNGGLPVPGSNYRMSGLNPGTSYYIRLDVSYNDQGSFFKVISSNIISTVNLTPPTTPSNLTVTRDDGATTKTKLVWTFNSVNYAHGDYTATDFKWGVSTDLSAYVRSGNSNGLPVVGSSYNMTGLNPGTSYYIRLEVSYNNQVSWKGITTSGTISTVNPTPPTAPTYPLANVVRGITDLTFNVDSFTAESHGDYSGVFTGYYVFISLHHDTKYAQGSTGNLVITGLNIDTSYTVKFYKKYNTNDFDNFASAYVNYLNVRALLIPSLFIDRFNVDMSLHLNLYPWSNVHSSSRDSGDIVQIIPISWEIWSRSVANGAETLLSDSSTLYWVGERTVPFGTYYLRRITYTINGVIFNALVQTYILSGSSTGHFKASYKLKYSDGNTSEVFYRTIPISHTSRYTDYTNIATI
jgi:hypothetical protein